MRKDAAGVVSPSMSKMDKNSMDSRLRWNDNNTKHQPKTFPTICWECQNLITQIQPSCDLCHKIQAPTQLDPFDRLGVAPNLHIDLSILESSYIRATALCHPDRFSNCPIQKCHGEAHMTALNQAYAILKDHLSRSIALYERVFGPYQEENIPCATLFLMAIFDLQERAEHLNGPEEEADFRQELQVLMTQAELELTQAFEKVDAASARRHIQALQYLTKLLIEPKERPHAPSNM